VARALDEASERVLVVDDQSSIRRLIARMVGTTGHPVDTASSAAEARKALAAQDFALVICDLRMGESFSTPFSKRKAKSGRSWRVRPRRRL
jgi:DNA-binding NtrC family response regulator